MKSGLDGRNNRLVPILFDDLGRRVSMKSGLDGRNNWRLFRPAGLGGKVSMKSGLDGRNNPTDRAEAFWCIVASQ